MKNEEQQSFDESVKWTIWNWFFKKSLFVKILILTPIVLLSSIYFLIHNNIIESPFLRSGSESIPTQVVVDVHIKSNDGQSNIIQEPTSYPEKVEETTFEEIDETVKISVPTSKQKPEVKNLPRIYIESNFFINNEQGILDETYKNGDKLNIEYSLDHKCYLTVISMDQNTIRGSLPGGDLTPKLNDVKKFTIEGRLDESPGFEVFYVIASHKAFNYSEIENILKKKQNDFNSKGIGYGEFELRELPEGFYQNVISFYHK